MKAILTLFITLMVSLSLGAQADSLHRVDSVLHNDSLLRGRANLLAFPAAIDAVLRDFPHNLRHITGELLLAQGETENYASLVEMEGAENCVVTRYHSTEDSTASWQAKMFSSDDFEKAAIRYRELFRKLQGCSIQLEDSSIVNFQGSLEPPRENVPFTASTLSLRTGDWRYDEVRVELELVYLMADWAIHINVISKKRDDEVGGKAVTTTIQ